MLAQLPKHMSKPVLPTQSTQLATQLPTRLNVHLHSVLTSHGGAARVVDLIAQGLIARNLPANNDQLSASCEIDDCDNNLFFAARPLANQILPAQLGAQVQKSGPGTICHLHSTQSWPQACASLAAANLQAPGSSPASNPKNNPVCITLHDCSLLTGGCFNPLGCPGWVQGCFEPCPLKYANAPQVQAQKREALQLLKSVQPPLLSLVAPSAWLCRMVKEALPDFGCKHIPNGVEVNPFEALASRASLGVAAHARMILFVAHGGLQAYGKGAGSWLRIWQNIKCHIPQALCFMVGGEDVKKESDLVHLPYVDRPTMQKLMAAADLLVYPSLADNHPLVVLEAMSAATPVCSYAVGGIPEQVRYEEGQGQTGLLVKSGDAAALAQAACKILTTPGLARQMGINAKNAFERHFRAEQMVDKYVALYQQLGA